VLCWCYWTTCCDKFYFPLDDCSSEEIDFYYAPQKRGDVTLCVRLDKERLRPWVLSPLHRGLEHRHGTEGLNNPVSRTTNRLHSSVQSHSFNFADCFILGQILCIPTLWFPWASSSLAWKACNNGHRKGRQYSGHGLYFQDWRYIDITQPEPAVLKPRMPISSKNHIQLVIQELRDMDRAAWRAIKRQQMVVEASLTEWRPSKLWPNTNNKKFINKNV
jgi:hypothetical protein